MFQQFTATAATIFANNVDSFHDGDHVVDSMIRDHVYMLVAHVDSTMYAHKGRSQRSP